MTAVISFVWNFLTDGYILPTDDFDHKMRKSVVTIMGICFIFGPFGAYYIYSALDENLTAKERTAIIVLACVTLGWGFYNMTLLLTSRANCDATITKTYLIVWGPVICCFIMNFFVDFIPCQFVYIAMATLATSCHLPSHEAFAYLVIFLILLENIRNAFKIPYLLRLPDPYQGTSLDVFVYSFPIYLCCMIFIGITVALKLEQSKQLATAISSSTVANEVASLLMLYNTEKADEVLSKAIAPIVVNDETGETAKPAVDFELINALKEVVKNLNVYRKFLPSYVFLKDDMEEDLNLYASKDSKDDDDEEEDRTKKKKGDETNENAGNDFGGGDDDTSGGFSAKGGSKKRSSAEHCDSDGAPVIQYGAGTKSNLVRRRSWEADSSEDSQLTGNSNNSNGIQQQQQQQQQNQMKTQQIGIAMKGRFQERLIVANISMSRVSEILFLLLLGSDHHKLHAHHHKNASLMREASTRINKIIELFLEDAAVHEATIHSLVGDQVVVSWNAAAKTAHADVKACRSILSIETLLRKEIKTWISKTSSPRLQKLISKLLKNATSQNNNNNSNKSLAVMNDRPDLEDEEEEEEAPLLVRKNSTSPSLSKDESNLNNNNNNNNSGVIAARRSDQLLYVPRARAQTTRSTNTSGVLVDLENGSSTGATIPIFTNNGEIQPLRSSNPSNPTNNKAKTSEELANECFDLLFYNRSALSGALINGNAWVQLGGSAKRQQFMLTNFSEAEMFETANKIGLRGNFIVTCRVIHQNCEHEFRFRGCGVFFNDNAQKILLERQRRDDVMLLQQQQQDGGGGIGGGADGENLKPHQMKDDEELNGELAAIAEGAIISTQVIAATRNQKDMNLSASVKVTTIARPLFELLCKKKLSTNDDEWLYLIAGKDGNNNNNNNNGSSSPKGKSPQISAKLGVGTDGSDQIARRGSFNANINVNTGMLLNEAVVDLCKGNVQAVEDCLARMKREGPEAETLPATTSVKRSLYKLKSLMQK